MNIATALIWAAGSVAACANPPQSNPAIVDPAPDKTHPAGNVPLTIPVGAGAINALLYTAAGSRKHPTLLLLHGFPGNEQNLDLAQAARRAGWNVLTMHYRGTWGSAGRFSFAGAAEDARAALAYLRNPANANRFGIDVNRIAVAGHSMGGMMAAEAVAGDSRVMGLFLIDPWDMAADGKRIDTAAGARAWHEEMLADQPALSGTNEATLAAEMKDSSSRFDLAKVLRSYGRRPLDIIGARRGNGPANAKILATLQRSVNPKATGDVWSTDHSFDDLRIRLATRLVAWLETLDRSEQSGK